MKDDASKPAGAKRTAGQQSCKKLCVQVIDLLSGLEELNIPDEERDRMKAEAEDNPYLHRIC